MAGPAAVAVVGIGNPLAGDDGAGPAVVEALRRRLGEPPWLLLARLEGDLFALADLLPRARRFIFVDAVLAAPPGQVLRNAPAGRPSAPTVHQVEVGAVMAALATAGLIPHFPPWEVRGITIAPPLALREGLSPAVAAAVETLAEELAQELAAWRGSPGFPG